ncbi:transglutaminaseTgpA domain-containing protein [uncultured Sphaerotilus sp.]|uniref:transglutaminase family protein n=1 Tax=uncultured Sphaerotilus sp. TaxID=474984 RepID=UPI0030CA406D
MSRPALPRESRDTLFLLAALAWTLLPQCTQVPLWCAVLAYAALGWRAWLAWSGQALPSRHLLLLALVGASAGTLISHQSLLGPSAGVTLLVVLSALKTLELRARRDATVVFYLGFFLVLANFLHSQSLVMAVAMGLSVWLLLTALVLAHLPDRLQTPPPLRQALALSARLLLTGLPLVVALFLLFPRVAPLWSMPGPGTARTGLSDHLSLGDVAELAQDDTLALRLQFDGPAPASSQLYFRGPVLSEPDGSGWQRRRRFTAGTDPAVAATPARQVRYEMTVEPLGLGTLPLLENARTAPTQPDAGPDRSWLRDPEGAWTPERPLTERLRVQATAVLDTPVHDPATPPDQPVQPDDPRWRPYLAVPEGQHPRTIAWADEHGANLGPPRADSARRAQWLLDHIRQQPFVYTLAPGLSGPDPVDSFWLDRRAGFCEHYASAVVVVLRRWGVPARIVTGYLGGQVNPLNGVLEVRQRDAHAWVEYWQGHRGWVRLDPTGAVAPERIERGERLAAPRGLVGQTLLQLDPQLLEQARALWGAAEHQWNQWVLGYSSHRQQDLLRALGWDGVDSRALGQWLAGAFAAVVGIGAAWVALRTRLQRRDPWLLGHARLLQILRRRGYEMPGHLAPTGLLAHLATMTATTADLTELRRPLELLSQWRYADTAQRPPLRPLWRSAQQAARRLPRRQGTQPARTTGFRRGGG